MRVELSRDPKGILFASMSTPILQGLPSTNSGWAPGFAMVLDHDACCGLKVEVQRYGGLRVRS